MRKRAIGYLRHDLSGIHQNADEIAIRSLAARLGYDLCKTVVFGPETDRRTLRLHTVVSRVRAQAIVVPSIRHFDADDVPEMIMRAVTVIAVDTGHTHERTCATDPNRDRR
ncbi:hypothetical protein [Nocardia jejuensis]|uniref:hypothetical protein n=1 Tax=Nocardia jejuensis TaxID=328049 RepID=UPI000833B09D|nr:hypothetical protein [Nocardia jejuensis]